MISAGAEEANDFICAIQLACGSPCCEAKCHMSRRVQGGFLAVILQRDGARSRIRFECRDVTGKVAYSWRAERAV